MTFSISFYGTFIAVDAHFACMDGVRLDFLSLLRFLEHWLVHNSGVSFFPLARFDLSKYRVCTNILVILHVLLRLLLCLGIYIL